MNSPPNREPREDDDLDEEGPGPVPAAVSSWAWAPSGMAKWIWRAISWNPSAGIERPPDRVLLEGLDLGHGHPGGAEAVEGMLDQSAAQSLAAESLIDGQVMNPADPRLGVDRHGDVTDRGPAPDIFRNRQLASR